MLLISLWPNNSDTGVRSLFRSLLSPLFLILLLSPSRHTSSLKKYHLFEVRAKTSTRYLCVSSQRRRTWMSHLCLPITPLPMMTRTPCPYHPTLLILLQSEDTQVTETSSSTLNLSTEGMDFRFWLRSFNSSLSLRGMLSWLRHS